MIFYHYTAANRLQRIMEEGLSKGQVPLTREEHINAVWLTTDKDAGGHGLGEARLMTEAERAFQAKATGQVIPEDQRWDNKREVRITIKLPSTDRDLTRWMTWGRKRLTDEWFDTLTKAGGGKRKAETWWLYWGVIPPELFHSVEHLTAAP